MYQADKPRNRMKMIAASAGLGAMAVMGVMTAINGAAGAVASTGSMNLGSTVTQTTPPTAAPIVFASPTVTATFFGKG
jgi:hypothetical protein